MEDNTGGSFAIDPTAFGLSGSTSTVQASNAPVAQEGSKGADAPSTQTNVEVVNESNANTQAPQVTDAEVKPDADVKGLEKKLSESHRHTIDLMEEKFADLTNGRIEDEELRKWFTDHPDLADLANRSKRLKDGYRSLMDRNPEVRRGDKTVDKTVEEVDDVETPKSPTPDDRPLTVAEYRKLQEEQETRILEKTLTRERNAKLEEFAVARNVKDDAFTKLKTYADALFKSDNSFENYEEAMEAAYRVIIGSKGNTVNITGNSATSNGFKEDKIDATKGIQLMSREEVFGKK
jgi:hypothetical protein